MKKLIFITGILVAISAIGCRKEKSDGATSAQADTLQMLSEKISSLSYPLADSGDVAVDSMILSKGDSILTLYVTLDDDLVDSAAMAADMEAQKFALGLLTANDTLAAILDMAVHAPVAIEVQAKGREYAPQVSFMIPADAVHTLHLERPGLRSRDEMKVRNRVRFDNAGCPFEIEDGVTLVSMSVQDRYVTFHTEIDVEKLDFLLMKQNRDSLNVGVVESLKAQLADPSQRQSLLDIAEARFGYRNRYVASDRRDSFDISFTPNDLIRLITVADSMAAITSGPKK